MSKINPSHHPYSDFLDSPGPGLLGKLILSRFGTQLSDTAACKSAGQILVPIDVGAVVVLAVVAVKAFLLGIWSSPLGASLLT